MRTDSECDRYTSDILYIYVHKKKKVKVVFLKCYKSKEKKKKKKKEEGGMDLKVLIFTIERKKKYF